MDMNNFRRFLELIGHRVIESDSCLWCEMAPRFYESIPFYRCQILSQTETQALFQSQRVLGLKFRVRPGIRGSKGCVYICEAKHYDLESLHPKMRNKVRQGLKYCEVKQIDFDYLQKYGLPINQQTLTRHNRDDQLFSNPSNWARFCEAGKKVQGAMVWGSFYENQLAAYAVIFITGEYCNILYQHSRTDLLHTKANNVLSYIMTKELMSLPDISYVSYGLRSIRGEQPGLDEYKTRLGYKHWPVNYIVVLNPILEHFLLNRTAYGSIDLMCKIFPNNDFLKRARGIVEIAKDSYIPGKRVPLASKG